MVEASGLEARAILAWFNSNQRQDIYNWWIYIRSTRVSDSTYQEVLLIVSFSAVTEIWDFEFQESEIIEPTLGHRDYGYGMAIFEVDAYFCNI